MIRWIFLGTTANGGQADAVGVAEVNLEGGDSLSVPDFHQRHSVGTPDFTKGTAFGKQSAEAVAIGSHGFGTEGVQRDQDVIAAGSKAADPVLRAALAGIAHQFRSLGGALDESAERLERKRRETIPDLQRQHSWPGNADVEAIVGLAARGVAGIVARSRFEPDVPVFSCGDLWRVSLIVAD